ncbi:hypothetical protein ABPG74_013282 [Tetrahymena malaccensis]
MHSANKQSPKQKSKVNMNQKHPDFIFNPQVKLPDYDGVNDKYLQQFFEKKQIRRHLKKMGLFKKNNESNKENIKKKELSPLKLKTEITELARTDKEEESDKTKAIEMRKYAHSTNTNRKTTLPIERFAKNNMLLPSLNHNQQIQDQSENKPKKKKYPSPLAASLTKQFHPKTIHSEAQSTKNKFQRSLYGIDTCHSTYSNHNTSVRQQTPKLRESFDEHKNFFIHQYDIPKSTKSQLDNYNNRSLQNQKGRERSHSSMNTYQTHTNNDKLAKMTTNDINLYQNKKQLRNITPSNKKRNNSLHNHAFQQQNEEEIIKTSTRITGQQLKSILDKYRSKVQESMERSKLFNQTSTRYSPQNYISSDEVPHKPQVLTPTNSNPNSTRKFSTVKEVPYLYEESERKKTKTLSIQTIVVEDEIKDQQIYKNQNTNPQQNEYQAYLQQNNLFTLNPQKSNNKYKSTIDSKIQSNNSQLENIQKKLEYSLLNNSSQQNDFADKMTANFSYIKNNQIRNNSSLQQKSSIVQNNQMQAYRIPTEKDEKISIKSKKLEPSRIGLNSNTGTLNEDSQGSFNQDKPPISIQSNKEEEHNNNSSYLQYQEYIQQKSIILPQITNQQKKGLQKDLDDHLDQSLINFNSQLSIENNILKDKIQKKIKQHIRITQSPELNEIVKVDSNINITLSNNNVD